MRRLALTFILALLLFIYFILFINFWPCRVFIGALAFSSCGEWGLLSSGGARAPFVVEHGLPGSKAQAH